MKLPWCAACVAFLFAFAARAAPVLVARTHQRCTESTKPAPFAVRDIPGGAAFVVSLPVDSACFSASAVLDGVSEGRASLRVTPEDVAMVAGACEITCKSDVEVHGYITGVAANEINIVALQLPTKTIIATRDAKTATFVAQTATVSIKSTPSDAAVFRGMTTLIGRTPLVLFDEPAGGATYHVVKGELAARLTPTLDVGERRELKASLVATPEWSGNGGFFTYGIEVIESVANKHREGLARCLTHKRARGEQQDQVVMKWVVNGEGRVTQVQAVSPPSQASACLLREIKTWSFPKPRGGGIAIVTQPFSLRAE